MLPLLTEILASKPTGVILTTYALTPSFFEYQFVNPLLAAGCEHIVLLVDRHGYDAMVAERAALSRAGVDYWVVPVDMAPFVFHAKLSLIWSDTEVRMYVSSANLTKGGLGSNLEVVDRLVCRNGDTSALPHIHEAIRVLRALIARQPVGHAAHSGLNEILNHCSTNLNSLGAGASAPSGDQIHFLHNLDQSLFDQLSGLISFEPNELKLISPFFDPDLSTLVDFAERFPKARIVVAQGPRGTSLNPKAGANLPKRISPASLKGTAMRYVHAKVLLATGSERSALVSGSPNLTSAAWKHDSTSGNFETAIAHLSSKLDTFRRFFDKDIQLSSVKWDRLAYSPPKVSSYVAHPKIAWAELSGNDLSVRLVGVNVEAVPSPTEFEISTRDGLFRVTSSIAPRSSDGVVVVQVRLSAACVTAAGSTTSVAVRLGKGTVKQSFWVKAILIVPEDIGSSRAFKHARQAYNRIQQGDAEGEDLLALLAFVQCEMTKTLSGAGSARFPEGSPTGTHKTGQRADNETSGLGVLLEDDDSFFTARQFGNARGQLSLLNQIPSLFRALMQDTESRTGAIPRRAQPDAGESDEEDESILQDQAADSDAVIQSVIETLDWIADCFECEDNADSQSGPLIYLLDFGLSIARYFYLTWHSGVDRESDSAHSYVIYIRRLLTASVSAARSTDGEPKGYFLRITAKSTDHFKRRRIPGRILYHICELCDFRWEEQSQSLRELRYILTGSENLFGQHLETIDDAISTAEELANDNANVLFPLATAGSMRAAITNLRAQETPEDVAKRRFLPLLRLRKVSHLCIDLKRQIDALTRKQQVLLAPSTRWRNKQDQQQSWSNLQAQIQSLTESLSEAEFERKTMREECAQGHPDEMVRYDGFYRRGQWRFIDYLPVTEVPCCPFEGKHLPTIVLSQLSDITNPIKCLSCSGLIIPFSKGAVDVD